MFIAQGRTVSDYQRSIEMMIQVWQRWEPWLAPPKLIGLGSVCRRSTSDPESGLYSILRGLYGCLPDGCKLHLFSVKGTAIDEVCKLPCIGSLDGMAWHAILPLASKHAKLVIQTAIGTEVLR